MATTAVVSAAVDICANGTVAATVSAAVGSSRDPHESQLDRLRSGTSRTNPLLVGETLDELHGLVNYFGVAFAYAFGYARFQMVAQQHF